MDDRELLRALAKFRDLSLPELKKRRQDLITYIKPGLDAQVLIEKKAQLDGWVQCLHWLHMQYDPKGAKESRSALNNPDEV